MYQVPRALVLIWSDLFRDRLFIIGLAAKLFFIFLFVPVIQQEWFVSFMVQTFENPSFHPWSSYLDAGGEVHSFPYGPAMFLAHLPSTLIGWLTDSLTGLDYFSGLGFRVSLLMADILILVTLLQEYEDRWKGILIHYWISPIVIFVTYWHGQTDLIPVALLVVSLAQLKNKKILKSGVFFAGAVAAKHSMLIALPFIVIYLWFKRGIVFNIYKFSATFFALILILEGPFILSPGFQEMVISTKESDKIFLAFLSIGDLARVYMVPFAYVFLLYFSWRLRKMNFDLLLAVLGIAFCTVILLTPPTPGWFLWISPILAVHLSKRSATSATLGALLSFIFVGYHLVYSSGSSVAFLDNVNALAPLLDFFFQSRVQSLLNTLLLSMIFLVVLQMFRDGVKGNDYYYLGKRPLVIGVSGGSSSGRTEFSNMLSGLLGIEQVLKVSDDNYYKWNLSSPIWKKITPLNPKSSFLHKMVYDLRGMLEGGEFKGHTYNSKSGVFSYKNRQKPRQVIILNSAFALHVNQLLNMEDIKFFVDMKGGIREDGAQRKTDQIKAKKDFEKYILPQEEQADVVCKVLPVAQEDQSLRGANIHARLSVKFRDGFHCQELVRVLIGVCGLQVNTRQLNNGMDGVEIDIQGEVDVEDIRLASKMIAPMLDEFIDDTCDFSGGIFGLVQLIALTEIDRVLKQRRYRAC